MIMRCLASILALLLVHPALAADLHVPGDHDTIQAAINAAADGDRVLVGPGTWTERLTIRKKTLSLIAESGQDDTIIDASGTGRQPGLTIKDCPSTDTRVVGFTFTGGKGSNVIPRGEVQGGGILVVDSSPTIINCTFRSNHAQYGCGGGGSILGGHPTFLHCRFTDNTSEFIGGGLLVKEGAPRLIGCEFTGNTATNGAGLYLWRRTHVTLLECRFTDNIASGHGGGLYVWNAAGSIDHCTFSGNTATGGAAISTLGTTPDQSHCHFGDDQSVEDVD
jgi:predicted outer membrane repeat protein